MKHMLLIAACCLALGGDAQPCGCTGDTAIVVVTFGGVNSMDLEGDTNNVIQPRPLNCAGCTVVDVQLMDVVTSVNPPSTCDQMQIKFGNTDFQDFITVSLAADPDSCSNMVSTGTNDCFTLGDDGTVYMEFFESVDNFPDQADAVYAIGAMQFTLLMPNDTCNICVTDVEPGACNPLTNMFDLCMDLHYTPTSGITVSIADQQWSIEGDTSGQSELQVVLPADGAVHDITVALDDQPGCMYVYEEAFTSPEACSTQCLVVIDSLSNGDCDTASNLYALQVHARYNNPFGDSLRVSADGNQNTFEIDSNGQGTFTLMLDSDGAMDSVKAEFTPGDSCNSSDMEVIPAPELCTTSCYIKVGQVQITECNPDNNKYTVCVEVTYANPPGDIINLRVDGVNFQVLIDGSGHETFCFSVLASGSDYTAVAAFAVDLTCRDTADVMTSAPEPCSEDCFLDIYNIIVGECDSLNQYVLHVNVAAVNPVDEVVAFRVGNEIAFDQLFNSGATGVLRLPANGETQTIVVFMTSDTTCRDTLQFTAPPVCTFCSIEVSDFRQVGGCSHADNSYQIDFTLSYWLHPGLDILIMIGDTVIPGTISGAGPDMYSIFLDSDGVHDKDFLVQFVDDPECFDFIEDSHDAPEPCVSTAVNDLYKRALLHIHPVPASETISVCRTESLATHLLTLTDVHGRILMATEIFPEQECATLNVTSLSHGVYFLIDKSNDLTTLYKIVVE